MQMKVYTNPIDNRIWFVIETNQSHYSSNTPTLIHSNVGSNLCININANADVPTMVKPILTTENVKSWPLYKCECRMQLI